MHEETLLRDLRRKIIEVARNEGNPSVRRVRIWIGPLAHVTPESLRRRWSEVVSGTPAENSSLQVDLSDDTADPAAQTLRLVEMTIDDGTSPGPKD